MQAPLEIGQILTPTLAQERGYPCIRDLGPAQMYRVEGGEHRPPVFVVTRKLHIETMTIHETIAVVALYVL